MSDELLDETRAEDSEKNIDENQTENQTENIAGAAVPEASGPVATPPQYGVGPFSIREVALVGVWLVAFVVSFFSLSPLRFESVWTAGLTWILTIAVPTVAVFLLVLRRLSPDGIRRVGSLGIDQFASVAFSVSAALWLTYMWETISFAISGGPWIRSWVMWVEFVLMLAGVVLTVVARYIPVLGEDFRFRPEVAAHTSARPLRPVLPRPVRPAAVPAEAPADAGVADPSGTPDEAYAGGYAAAGAAAAPQPDADPFGSLEPTEAISADSDAEWAPVQSRGTYEPAAAPVRHQAFWVITPQERDVVDERGFPVFRIGPSAWALAIEDRGDHLVIRDEDGRIGYLHDITDVQRG